MKCLKQILQITNGTLNAKRRFHFSPPKLNQLQCSPNSQLDKNISDRYMCLPIPEPKTQICYVWIDGTGIDLRTKTRTLDFVPSTYKECPNWTFDGSSTFFSGPEKSDYYIVPIAMYPDPFRRGNNKIVLCEAFTPEKKPTKTNNRQCCIETLNKVCDHEVKFGFEQEFFLVGHDDKPYGWPCGAKIDTEGKSYCGIGSNRVTGRDVVECIYRCCLYSGVDAYSCKAEIAFGQWELVTGPTLSIKAADDLWLMRYIISRVSEDYGLTASFKAKLVPNAPGSALHTAMSTKNSRQDEGIKYIEQFMKKLEKNHANDIKSFDLAGGGDMRKRFTGKDGSPCLDKFKSGVGDRTAHVKLSPAVIDKKKGFFEDRRPCANADPYLVIATLIKSCLL
ncbi:glutamine synthetase 2 cytoplasmic-like [Sitophilus oryzae]|uniref:glutamine synthetase n=1 Tax=Sitophilus oryzae TaxID=7048 RepID=A0A6J2YB88_SITOR|nr:glutamine synthetase 2 cytoplasmic-like [Sitophilus oryzae]